MKAYADNTRTAVEAAIELNPFAQAILGLMQEEEPWQGPASELLARLCPIAAKVGLTGQAMAQDRLLGHSQAEGDTDRTDRAWGRRQDGSHQGGQDHPTDARATAMTAFVVC